MNKLIFLLILVVFGNCSEKQDILITKKVYTDISKNAIFNASKTLFTLSNIDNGNKSFVVDSYRDRLEVNKVMFNSLKIEVDKWILELYQTETETRANLI